MSKKGQALVEFILILPVLLILLLGGIDLGRVILEKNKLESRSTEVINLLDNGRSYEEVKSYLGEIDLSITYGNDSYATIKLTSCIDLITPLANVILNDPYCVNVKRVIPYEQ